jgi:outer membrane protein OmpA-like peptidoglycan-associated protein
MFGVGYVFDLTHAPEREVVTRDVERRVEVPPPEPPRGKISGTIVDSGTGSNIPGVTVRFTGRNVTPQYASDGTFTSEELDPGPVSLELTHPDYDPGTCNAEIDAEGHDTTVRCELVRAVVVVQESEVEIRDTIHFAFDSAEILEASFPLMERIASVFRDHPELVRVEIQGHTDNQGTAAYNLDLSQKRAESVRTWLTEHDAAPERLEARGYGLTRPIDTNETDEGRSHNRRVEFIILERGAPAASLAPTGEASGHAETQGSVEPNALPEAATTDEGTTTQGSTEALP